MGRRRSSLIDADEDSSWYFHIPTDLVVVQEASAVESSSRLDFLLLHNLGMSFVAP